MANTIMIHPLNNFLGEFVGRHNFPPSYYSSHLAIFSNKKNDHTSTNYPFASFAVEYPKVLPFLTDKERVNVLFTVKLNLNRAVAPVDPRVVNIHNYVKGCVEVYENAIKIYNGEELFHVIPGPEVLASIPKDVSIELPTQQELRAVLEDFHRIGFYAKRISGKYTDFELAVVMSMHPRLGADSRLGVLTPELLKLILVSTMDSYFWRGRA